MSRALTGPHDPDRGSTFSLVSSRPGVEKPDHLRQFAGIEAKGLAAEKCALGGQYKPPATGLWVSAEIELARDSFEAVATDHGSESELFF